MQTQNSRHNPLTDLMEHAKSCAAIGIRDSGGFSSTAFVHGPTGYFMFFPEGNSVKDLAEFEETIRLVCIATGTKAVVFGSEVRAKLPNSKVPHSAVLLMGRSIDGSSVEEMLPIARTTAGKFVGFGQVTDLQGIKVDLPLTLKIQKISPTIQEQLRAVQIIDAKGIFAKKKNREQDRGYGRAMM